MSSVFKKDEKEKERKRKEGKEGRWERGRTFSSCTEEEVIVEKFLEM